MYLWALNDIANWR